MSENLEFEFKFTEVIRLLGRPVTFYPTIALALGGNVNAGLFVSNFWYWEGKQSDQDEGWIYKSQREIQLETGLSRYQQESARRLLREFKIMQEERRGAPAKLYYRFNWDRLNEILSHHFAGHKQEKRQVEDSLKFKLKRVFDKHFMKGSKGIPFEWGTSGKGSKEWRGLKHLTETFEDLIAFKRCVDQGIVEPTRIEKSRIDVLDDDIISSFDHFLHKLPEWDLLNSMSPELLYSRFNKIIIKIQQDGQTKLQRNGATEYVKSRGGGAEIPAS